MTDDRSSVVVPIRACASCGRVAVDRELALRERVVGTIRACTGCLEAAEAHLAKVRPVFDAMIGCGVDREVANDTMTFMLTAMDERRT